MEEPGTEAPVEPPVAEDDDAGAAAKRPRADGGGEAEEPSSKRDRQDEPLGESSGDVGAAPEAGAAQDKEEEEAKQPEQQDDKDGWAKADEQGEGAVESKDWQRAEEADKEAEEDGAEKEEEKEEQVKEMPEVWVDGEFSVAVDPEDATWLLDDDGRRRLRLERIVGATTEVTPEGKVTFRLKPPDDPADTMPPEDSSAQWAAQSLRAICALRTGAELRVKPGTRAPPERLVTIVVPTVQVKKFIKGKDGNRLVLESDANDVVAVFAEPCAEEAEVPAKEVELEAGAQVEAKYGDKWYEATIVEVGESNISLKWHFDDSNDEVARSDVRQKEVTPEEPPERLMIHGHEQRGLLVMELKALQLIAAKVPSGVTVGERTSAPLDVDAGIGMTIVPLTDDGAMLPKLIGKGGTTRMKIARACKSSLEYIDKHAWIVGTGEERVITAAVLTMLQLENPKESPPAVPDALEDWCKRVEVPPDAKKALFSDKRSALNTIEEETKTLIINTMPIESDQVMADDTPPELTVGAVVESKLWGEWQKAEIVEIITEEPEAGAADAGAQGESGGGGSKSVKLKWCSDGEEVVVYPDAVRRVLEGPAAAARKRQEYFWDGPPLTFAVLGHEKGRAVAELRLFAAIEAQCPGASPSPKIAADGSGTEVMPLTDAQVESCQGQEAAGRIRTAAAAAQCVGEVVGRSIYVVGSGAQRALAQQFLRAAAAGHKITSWEIDDFDKSSYTTHLVPKEKRRCLPAAELAKLEKEFETFMYFDDSCELAGVEDADRLVICGHDEEKRAAAIASVEKLQEMEPPPEEETWAQEEGNDKWSQEKWKGDQSKAWGEEKDDKKAGKWPGKEEKWWGNDSSDKWSGSKEESWQDDKKNAAWGGKKEDKWADKEEKWPSQKEDKWSGGSGGGGGQGDWWKKEPAQQAARDDRGGGWNGPSGWPEPSWGDSRGDRRGGSGGGGGGGGGGWDSGMPEVPDRGRGGSAWNAGPSQRWEQERESWPMTAARTPPRRRERDRPTTSSRDSYSDVGPYGVRRPPPPPARDDPYSKRRRLEDEDDEDAFAGGRRRGAGGFGHAAPWRVDEAPEASSGSRGRYDDDSPPRPGGPRHLVPRPPSMPPPSFRSPAGAGMMYGGGRSVHVSRGDAAPPPRMGVYSRGSDRGGRSWQDEPFDGDAEVDMPRDAEEDGFHSELPDLDECDVETGGGPNEDPKHILSRIGFPDTIDGWEAVQGTVFGNMSPLPPGWIRIWSKSNDCPYYLRLEDDYSTFEYTEVV